MMEEMTLQKAQTLISDAMAGGAVLRDGDGHLLGGIGVTGLAASEDQQIVDRLAARLSEA